MEDNGADAWELSKENIQPRKEGRNISSLMVGLTPRKDNAMKLHNEKQQYELALRTYDGLEKLEVWYRYIVWTEQHFPGGSGFDVRQLIERCIKFYKDDNNIKNDVRYLSIWLKYADMLTDPTEVFNYLYSQEIGTQYSQFYKSWATALENSGLFAKADEVYCVGEARGAQPLEILKSQHRQFEKRCMAKRSNMEELIDIPDDSQSRVSLAALKKTSKGRVSHERAKGRSGSSRHGIEVQQQGNNKAKNSAFSVFEDENAPVSKLPSATGEWKQPPTNTVIVKENTQKAGQWTKAKISNAHSAQERQGPSFSIHVDEGVERVNDTPKQLIMSERKPLSSRKLDKQAVTVDPLRPVKQQADSTTEVKYCKNQVYMGNGEFSFEELRGVAWIRENGPIQRFSVSDDDRTRMVETSMEIDDTLLAASPIIAVETNHMPNSKESTVMPSVAVNGSEILEELPIIRSNLSARQKLSFHATTNTPDNKVVIANACRNSKDALQYSSTLPISSPASRPLLSKTAMECNLDVSGLHLIDETGNFGPTQSTTKYDINKIRHELRREMEYECHVLDCNEMSKIEPTDDFENDFEKMKLPGDNNCDVETMLENEKRIPMFPRVPTGIELPAFEAVAKPSSIRSNCAQTENVASNESRLNPFNDTKSQHNKMPSNSNDDNDFSRHWVQMPDEFIKPKPVKPAANEQESLQLESKQTNGKLKFFIFQDVQEEDKNIVNYSQKENIDFDAFAKTKPTSIGDRNSCLDNGPKIASNLQEDTGARVALCDKMDSIQGPKREAPFSVFIDSDNEIIPVKSQEQKSFGSTNVSTNINVISENNFSVSTPGMNLKSKSLSSKSPGFQVKPNSSYWAPSPTVHTKKAQMEILAMFNKSLDCDKDEFTLYQTQDGANFNDFENQFAETNMEHEKTRNVPFKIFDEDADESRPSQYSTTNASRASFTPSVAKPSLTSISCSTILHESNPIGYTYDIKDLSPIEEYSDEDKTGSLLGNPLNPWRNLSRSVSSRTFSQGSEADSEHSVAAHMAPASNTIMGIDGNIKPHNSDHFNTKPANQRSNSYVNPSKATNIVNLSNINHTKAVRAVDFGEYRNFHECCESLSERFAVKSIVKLENTSYKLLKKIATGGFSVVYLCVKLDQNDTGNVSEETVLKVMKLNTMCSWEFHISQQVQKRIAMRGLCTNLRDSFITPCRAITYDNGAVIEYPYFQEGTLLDLVNKMSQANIAISEDFALMYAADICRIVKAIHDCNIIHGDIKPDNFLQRSNIEQFQENTKINLLVLADFGRSIDLSVFSPDVQFTGSCNTDKFECIEMAQNLPWKYQIDYFGIACSIHVLIYGVYMECYKMNDRYHIIKSVKRCWDREFWSSVFDRLINSGDRIVLDDLVSEFNGKLEKINRRRIEQALTLKNQK